MNAGARVAAFVALLAVIFAGATLAGAAIDPESADEHDALHEDSAQSADHDRARHAAARAGEDADAAASPAGVASSQGGYRLVAGDTRFTAGREAPLTFRIVDASGATVRDFETEQARKMHVIVVRRDLRRYQHLHPTQRPDGTWATPLALPEAGVYRAFADFRRGGERHTLGTDLFVPGDFEPRAIPAASQTASVDGYEVSLREHGDELGFFVRRDGKLITDLQPYLGARGHLVALRAGDLAYEHVHPEPDPPPEIAFHVGASEPGTYRLFLQFRHEARVHTAAFTSVQP
jgi:Ni/Co efflux regulator RcnB